MNGVIIFSKTDIQRKFKTQSAVSFPYCAMNSDILLRTVYIVYISESGDYLRQKGQDIAETYARVRVRVVTAEFHFHIILCIFVFFPVYKHRIISICMLIKQHHQFHLQILLRIVTVDCVRVWRMSRNWTTLRARIIMFYVIIHYDWTDVWWAVKSI